MSSHIITPGPYRATKLWNEVTKLFRAGMPLKKHRQHLKVYTNCFTAVAAADWLHELLQNNSNFGPEVTRQQTVQLLKKFLKNHVIEDVKGRWGLEDLDDNNQLYKFPSTSPLKPIPNCPPGLKKRSFGGKEKEGFFRFRSSKIFDKEVQENVDPEVPDSSPNAAPAEMSWSREITEEDVQDVWRTVTLTHLQKILGLSSLDDVLDPSQVNAQHIVYNMKKVNKHGVVTLEDKTEDLPHWVLSAMKCLANWPKYDSAQPSYPGFERDVFKTVSDYFCSLPQPLLTFQYYELFVNILVLCGYVMAPKSQRGKRKNPEELCCPPPAKAPHVNPANLFRSTECLLLSLIRKEALEETESPMREVLLSKAGTQLGLLNSQQQCGLDPHGASEEPEGGGPERSCSRASGRSSVRLRAKSCSLETIADASTDSGSRRTLFRSTDSLPSCKSGDGHGSSPEKRAADFSGESHPCKEMKRHASVDSLCLNTCSGLSGPNICNALGTSSSSSSNQYSLREQPFAGQGTSRPARPRSVGNFLDVIECQEMSASCFSVNAPVAEITVRPGFTTVGLRRPSLLDLHGSSMALRAGPGIGRRCQSSLDLCRPAPAHPSVPTVALRRPGPQPRLLQRPLESIAVEALQLCTLLLPPACRRKLQLLLRMTSRMSQNVDMPRLHHAVGTRTLMVQTFSRCVLSCEEEMDLDELLATRLLSFLMDHHQEILQVPVHLGNAVEDHLAFLRTRTGRPASAVSMPTYTFCRQISTQEFEEQKLTVSQAAIADLLESLIRDKAMSVKEKKKKLKLFQREYPDIYTRRFPTTESEAQLFGDKPKIKPPMLISLRKAKTISIRN